MADSGNHRGVALWTRVALFLLPLALAGLVAWGRLNARADALERALEGKANRETVEAQYNAILRELADIKAELRALKR